MKSVERFKQWLTGLTTQENLYLIKKNITRRVSNPHSRFMMIQTVPRRLQAASLLIYR